MEPAARVRGSEPIQGRSCTAATSWPPDRSSMMCVLLLAVALPTSTTTTGRAGSPAAGVGQAAAGGPKPCCPHDRKGICPRGAVEYGGARRRQCHMHACPLSSLVLVKLNMGQLHPIVMRRDGNAPRRERNEDWIHEATATVRTRLGWQPVAIRTITTAATHSRSCCCGVRAALAGDHA